MTEPTIAVSIGLTAGKKIAESLVTALLMPAMRLTKIAAEPLIDAFSNRFSEYLSRQYAKHSYLPTIVFREERQPLEKLYVPLTLTSRQGNSSYTLNRYQPDFLPALRRVLIIDDAGMGKTTVSRHLLIEATKNLSTVPIFIELRHLSKDRSIIDEILKELNPVGQRDQEHNIQREQLTRLLAKGIFTFFLDGYDEINEQNLEAVTKDIKSLTEAYQENVFLLTSRPQHSLAAFASFRAFNIAPLQRTEAYELIRKYDSNGEKSEQLITKLAEESIDGVDEFLGNPLLTSLIYRAYEYKNRIPLKKHIFYRQVFDALFEWHDSTKDGYVSREKSSRLDIDDFHKVLRGIGFVSVLQRRVEGDTDTVLNWIRLSKGYSPELKFAEHDFLDDCIKAVPVMRRDGNSILWAHKSLAEYFAAQYIVVDAKLDQQKICEKLSRYKSLGVFGNLLDLLYGMDRQLFSKYFIIPLLDLYDRELASLEKLFPDRSKDALQRRASVTLGVKFCGTVAINVDEALGRLCREAVADWELPIASDEDATSHLACGMLTQSRSYVMLVCDHPLRAVYNVLTKFDHELIQTVSERSTRSLDLPRLEYSHVGDPTKYWNSSTNFETTTLAIGELARSRLDWQKIQRLRQQINLRDRKSESTDSILDSLD